MTDKKIISRRDFIKYVGLSTATMAINNCQRKQEIDNGIKIALNRCNSYDISIVLAQLQQMFEGIGDIKDIVKTGSVVGIKINLTGGKYGADLMQNRFNISAPESFWTHPVVLKAAIQILRDAGAGRIVVMEAIYDPQSYHDYGIKNVVDSMGCEFINLNQAAPYPDFINLSAGSGGMIYPQFQTNRILQEIDCFVSIAKMKCHQSCGLTLSLKNLIGIAPVQFYQLLQTDIYRSALHGVGNEYQTRLPKVIIDLNKARRIHLAIIDGIKTIDAGEGPWITPSSHPISPGILVAGKDPVATDVVAARTMGFNPLAVSFSSPFLNGDNHISLAGDHQLGVASEDKIEVIGQSIDSVLFPFTPSPKLNQHIISERP